nr:MAG TPA: hypothetical protein [Caudoviricetes sp.]
MDSLLPLSGIQLKIFPFELRQEKVQHSYWTTSH